MGTEGGKDWSSRGQRYQRGQKRQRERGQQGPLKKKSQNYRIEVIYQGIKRSWGTK